MLWNEFKEFGPFLSYGKNSAREMIISWESDQYLNYRRLYYGETEKCENVVEERGFHPTRHHSIWLKDLKPNTLYYYRIENWNDGSRSGEKNGNGTDRVAVAVRAAGVGGVDGVNGVFSFRTAPLFPADAGADSGDIEFDFAIVGDVHASASHGDVISHGFRLMDELFPDRAFTIAVGDSINNGNAEYDWQAFFKYLNPYLHNIPLMNTTGNHETNNLAKYCRFIATWDHPFVNVQNGAYYSFEYGNAAFIMLDSCNAGGQGGMEGLISDEQFDWLENELEKYNKKNYWTFLFLHHQIFSTGDFSIPAIMKDIYKPVFDEYHVDAVFYGHDHHFELFWFGYNEGKTDQWGGTKYCVAGGSGGMQRVDHSIMGDRDGKTKYVWPGRFYSYKEHGIIPPSPNITQHAMGFRDDEIVKNAQVYGVLEPSFVRIGIKGDEAILQCVGWQKQIHYEIKFKRTQK